MYFRQFIELKISKIFERLEIYMVNFLISAKKRYPGMDVPKWNKILTDQLKYSVIKSKESNYDKALVTRNLFYMSLDGTFIQVVCYWLLNKMLIAELKDQTITNKQIRAVYFTSIDGSSAQKKAYQLLEKRLSKKFDQSTTYDEKLEIHRQSIPDSAIYKKNQESLEEILIERLNIPGITRQEIEKIRSEAYYQVYSDRVTQIADNLLSQ